MKQLAFWILLFLFTKRAISCKFPDGVAAKEMGQIFTLTCPKSQSTLIFNRETQQISQNRIFLRVRCEKDKVVALSDSTEDVLFCTENNCRIGKSSMFSTFQILYNKSVLVQSNTRSVFYCLNFQWISLFENVIPKEIQKLNVAVHRNRSSTNGNPKFILFLKHMKEDSPVDETQAPVTSKRTLINHNRPQKKTTNQLKIGFLRPQSPLSGNHDNRYYLCVIATVVSSVSSVLFVVLLVVFLTHQRRCLHERLGRKLRLGNNTEQPSNSTVDSHQYKVVIGSQPSLLIGGCGAGKWLSVDVNGCGEGHNQYIPPTNQQLVRPADIDILPTVPNDYTFVETTGSSSFIS